MGAMGRRWAGRLDRRGDGADLVLWSGRKEAGHRRWRGRKPTSQKRENWQFWRRVGGWGRPQLAIPKITCGDTANELALSAPADRGAIKEEIDSKPMRQTKPQRAKADSQKRADFRRAWLAQIESGELDPRGIYWEGEKLFRLGARPGGDQNLAIWVKKQLGKSELPNDMILRGGVVSQGGCSATVSPVLSYNGKGRLGSNPLVPRSTQMSTLELWRTHTC